MDARVGAANRPPGATARRYTPWRPPGRRHGACCAVAPGRRPAVRRPARDGVRAGVWGLRGARAEPNAAPAGALPASRARRSRRRGRACARRRWSSRPRCPRRPGGPPRPAAGWTAAAGPQARQPEPAGGARRQGCKATVRRARRHLAAQRGRRVRAAGLALSPLASPRATRPPLRRCAKVGDCAAYRRARLRQRRHKRAVVGVHCGAGERS